MALYVQSEGAGPGSQVPPHLTRIPLALLSPSTDCTNRTVKGKVIHKGPLVRVTADDFILKTAIQEEEEDVSQIMDTQKTSINIIIFGALAESFSHRVSLRDVVWVSGFTVGKSPTANKDKFHPYNLLLSGDDAYIYVFKQKLPDPRSLLAGRRSSSTPAEASEAVKVPKYTYVRLDELKKGAVVNVYGVVVFFKQPFKSRGTDYCTILKITDQSDHKIGCTIFCEKLEDHPKIFQNGDIICMHKVKVKLYNKSLTLVNTSGFSVMTFSGAVGGPIQPRTSSKSFHCAEDYRGAVEQLRSWAASQTLLPSSSAAVPLSAVQPCNYFDLTCQLLAKASIDSTCTLLRVWDGTRSPHTLLKVVVEPNTTEGELSFSSQKEGLIADVLVYDNHVESARQLKPGAFLRIYNLRAIPGSSKVPGLTSSQQPVDHLAFHLHGGTSYGRGIQVLPENSPDVQQLKSVLEAFSRDEEEDDSELNDSELLVWSTPPEFLDADAVDCRTERSCAHHLPAVSLSQVKQSHPSQVHHVRAQLRSYQPHRLYQALKLFCSSCTSIQDIPDDERVAAIFSEASRCSEACRPPPWALSGHVDLPGGSSGSQQLSPSVHLSTKLMEEGRGDQLIFLRGSTLEETRYLAAAYQNIVPVRSFGGQLVLLDLSAPFLFRGSNRYYGCKQCSEAALSEPGAEGVELMDEKIIAEALGVKLLQPVFLMKLELQDATDTLEVFLWRHAELFFSVAAADVLANQEAQNGIQQTMDMLCPAEGSMGERPWLHLCLMAYRAEGDDQQNQTCYQICNTVIIKAGSKQLDPT